MKYFDSHSLSILRVFFGTALLLLVGVRSVPRFRMHWKAFEDFFENHFFALSLLVPAIYFILASAVKFSQLHTLQMSGQDFWLFEDLLRQTHAGAPFLTRYAPQAIGWVQHGVVHPMLSWGALASLVDVFSPTTLAILHGPLALSLAGWALMRCIRTHPGPAWFAILGGVSFLLSSLSSRILMYETHPEALYPFATLILFLSLRSASLWKSALATALLMSIKEDAGAIVFPLGLGLLLHSYLKKPIPLLFQKARVLNSTSAHPIHTRHASHSSRQGWTLLGIGILVLSLQMYGVDAWKSAPAADLIWNGAPVQIPPGAAAVSGLAWSSPSAVIQSVAFLLEQKGSPLGFFRDWIIWFFSRPHLSLLIAAPWILLSPRAIGVMLPLTWVYTLFPEAGKWVTYYSAPYLGLFWFFATQILCTFPKRDRWAFYFLILTAWMGGAHLTFYSPTPLLENLRSDTHAALQCLPTPESQGIVSSRLIGWVPEKIIYSDRMPEDFQNHSQVNFILIPRHWPSYEIPNEISPSPSEWREVNSKCQAVDSFQSKNHSPPVAPPPSGPKVPSFEHVRLWIRTLEKD